MKKIRSTVFLLTCFLCSLAASAQSKGGQIYFVRSLNYVGSAVPFNMYIDGKLVCKLKNNRYSVHDVTAGEHNVSIKNTGLGSHQMSRALTIKVEEGKINYITVENSSNLYLQEVTQASGVELLKKTTQTTKCPIKESESK
jgi:hypothetical protein